MAAKSSPPSERRKSQRRNAKSKVFVLFDQHRTKVGQLVDICQEGLCCIAGETQLLENIEAVSLVAYGEEHQYSVVRSIPLHDMQLEQSYDSAEKVLKIRLHFASLSHPQKRELATFLSIHTGPSGSGFNAAWAAL